MPGDSDKVGSLSGYQTHHKDFVVFADLCGIQADPNIFRIINELLEMDIEPDAIYKLLRSIRRSKYNTKHSEKPVKKQS